VAKSKVIDKDLGYKKILRNISKLNSNPYVKVGWLETAGTHKGSSMTVAQIASIHEFGAPSAGIPERAPIRKTIDSKKAEIQNKQEQLLDKVLLGKIDTDKGLALLGQFTKSEIQSTIRAGLTPPWAESTLAARVARSGGIVAITPLIDSGQTLRSVDYEVVIQSGGDQGMGKVEVTE
jgi:hypothetical protein